MTLALILGEIMNNKTVFFQTKSDSVFNDHDTLQTSMAKLPATATMEEKIIAAIRTVYDPEMRLNIYDLGLIYKIETNNGAVVIDMTLTAPACPIAEILPAKVAEAIKQIDGISDVKIDMVWQPAWSQDCMSDEAKLELGLF